MLCSAQYRRYFVCLLFHIISLPSVKKLNLNCFVVYFSCVHYFYENIKGSLEQKYGKKVRDLKQDQKQSVNGTEERR